MGKCILIGNSLDNTAEGDCKPYLNPYIAKHFVKYLHLLSKECECKPGSDSCTYLDYHAKDGSMTCKPMESTLCPIECRRNGIVLGNVFEKVPKEEDKICFEAYKMLKKLQDSCSVQ